MVPSESEKSFSYLIYYWSDSLFVNIVVFDCCFDFFVAVTTWMLR